MPHHANETSFGGSRANPGHYKHGHTTSTTVSPTYQSWREMHTRCTNKKHRSFKYYGARRICVCARWKHFEQFLADMGTRPPNTTLDRIDSNADYTPDNCRLANASRQSRNRRDRRQYTYDGRTMGLSDWADILGIKANTLRMRIHAYGWSVQKAFSTPLIHNA